MIRHILTGSYHNYFRIYDVDTLNDIVLQADKSAFKAKKIGTPLPANKVAAKNGARPGGLRESMAQETLDFNKKILHASWHPRENTIAVSLPCLAASTDPLTFGILRLLPRTICSCIAPHELAGARRSIYASRTTPHAARIPHISTLFMPIPLHTVYRISYTCRSPAEP